MSAYLNIPLGFGPMEAIGPFSFFLSSSAQLQPILLIPIQNSSPGSLSKAPKSGLATPVKYHYPILCYPNYHNVWQWSGTSLVLASPSLRQFTVINWKTVVINIHIIINYNLNCVPRTVQDTTEQCPGHSCYDVTLSGQDPHLPHLLLNCLYSIVSGMNE